MHNLRLWLALDSTGPSLSMCLCLDRVQVSTSSAVSEGKEVLFGSSSDASVRWDHQGGSGPGARPDSVHFVLEESSGYMEPTLRILAVLHTVISFFCIIGYYCLKVLHQHSSGNIYCIEASVFDDIH